MPRVYNRKKHHPPDAVLIDRTTPYGNPYRASVYGKEEAIRLFEEHVLPDLDVEPLRGKDLLCHHDGKCHGHSILRKLRLTRRTS
jgi:hypothetical protein